MFRAAAVAGVSEVSSTSMCLGFKKTGLFESPGSRKLCLASRGSGHTPGGDFGVLALGWLLDQTASFHGEFFSI